MNIIVKNLAVNYSIQGEGKTILLLHGWNNDLHSFDNLIPLLDGLIVRLDLPSFGKSQKPEEAWSLDDYVNFVEEFIKKLEIEPEIVIGHSFGGRIIIKGKGLGAKKVILIASAGVAQKKNLWRIASKIVKPILAIPSVASFIKPRFYRLIGSDYVSSPSKETFVKIISEDLISACRELEVPTLLIYGSEDRETPISDGRKLSDNMPNSSLKEIEGGSHFIHQERSQEVANLIKEFIND